MMVLVLKNVYIDAIIMAGNGKKLGYRGGYIMRAFKEINDGTFNGFWYNTWYNNSDMRALCFTILVRPI